MAARPDPDDIPPELLAESRYARRKVGFCRECFGTGGHRPGCPDDDTDAARGSDLVQA